MRFSIITKECVHGIAQNAVYISMVALTQYTIILNLELIIVC